MLRSLGPLNQRKLNKAIQEKYKGQYVDWYHLTKYLAGEGMNRAQICDHFEALGVKISQARLSVWITSRVKADKRNFIKNHNI